MAIAIRGTTPLVVATTANPISGTLTGARQPQTGDVLLIIHGNDYYALSNMPTPTVGGSTSGVNAISGGAADSGFLFAHAKSYTYVVGSTGDLAVSVTETGTADEEKVLVVYVLSGVDTSAPVDGTPGTNTDITGSTTNRVCNATSPSSSDAFLVVHTNDGNGSNSVSYTPPSGMSEQYDGSLAASMGYSGATLQLVASGSTGSKTFVAAGNASYCTLTIAVATSTGAVGSRPESGTTAAAAYTRGIAVKVVSLTGRCTAAAAPRATATKVASPQTSCVAASTSRATVVKRATPTATTLAALACTGTPVKKARPVGHTYAAAYTAKIDVTRSLVGHCYAGAATFPRPNPSDRPGTGTTGRPDSGSLLRPYSGVIHRP